MKLHEQTLDGEKAILILRLQIKFVFSMCENTQSLSGKRINHHQAQNIIEHIHASGKFNILCYVIPMIKYSNKNV